MAELTIVFADLTGSTGLFEALGNSQAAEVVTRTTQWLGRVCMARGGRVIKYLGDGVLVSFDYNPAAVLSAIEIQNAHRERNSNLPGGKQMKIKIGLARGEVVEQGGDCFGDAVNVASRLSDLSGADQIFASESVINALPHDEDIRFRNLGPMDIRGKSEPLVIYRIDWQRDTPSEFQTMASSLETVGSPPSRLPSTIELTWHDRRGLFEATDMPVFMGRGNDAHFAVLDPRVSRLHARLDRRGDLFVLSDISSYGTWVRFAGSTAVIALRRQDCVLLDKGEMALGASFDDPTAPIVSFWFTNRSGL
jgi:class 3 adenylate cyclase